MPSPPALPERPTVRVVHPCGSLAPHRAMLEAGLARLEAAGCRVRWDPRRADSCWRGYLAGPDDLRAAELIEALAEPGVDAIWFARGGSGGARIAERVVDAAAGLPPRVVVGFSDATVFLTLLATRLGWTTFHGPVVTSLASPSIDTDLDGALALLRGLRWTVDFAPSAGAPIEGRLLGGNLTVLAAAMGTGAAPRAAADAIWLLEDVGEAPYRLDRSFWQLRAGGLLRDARGLWIGDLGLDPLDAEAMHGQLAEDAGLPTVLGAPAGHRGPLALLPIGGRGRLDPAAGRFEALEPWVEPRRAS